MESTGVLPRRSFVKTFALFSASVCMGGKKVKSLFVADVAAQSTSQLGVFRLKLDDFPDLENTFGSVRLGVPGMPATFQEIIVTRVQNNVFYAVTSRCPHEGCTVEPYGVFSSFLECPCHGSRFDPSGALRRGPAGTGLTRYTTTFDGNRTVSIAIPNLGYSMTGEPAVNPTSGGSRLRVQFPTINGLQYELRFRASADADWTQVQFSRTADGEVNETVLAGNNQKATVYVDRTGDIGFYAVVRY